MTTPADAHLAATLDFETLLTAPPQAAPLHAEPARILGLKGQLVGTDVIALATGWSAGLLIPGLVMHESATLLYGNARWVLVGIVLSLVAIRTQQLYLARVCAIRTIEIQRLLRACALGGVGVFFFAQSLEQNVSVERMTIASFIALGALVAGRSAYRSRLRAARRCGRHMRSVVMIGNNDEAAELLQVTQEHPESGIAIVGTLANAPNNSAMMVPHLGRPADAVEAITRAGATGAIVVASSLPAVQLNPLVRRLLEAGIHVHVASGLRGISHSRIRPTPLAHEPLLYLERPTLSRWQLATKRVLDVVIAIVALVASLPVLLLAAVAVWLQDRGPILFRQERVGLHGKSFSVIKLRSMTPDAEERLAEVHERNERRDSPLFKLERDPRVTPVGRVLRATSIDELPQLFNVLHGTMSLVGPRPALSHEVDAFDPELGARTQVRPGITGLWQVEARDNAAFGPYRRLDLFYIENWSIGLDLSIMVGTAAAVIGRAVATLSGPPHAAESFLEGQPARRS